MNSWTEVWNTIFSSREWGKYPDLEVVRFCARNYYNASGSRSDVKVLDIGSGPGANTWYLAREGFSVSCIDGSRAAIDLLQKRLSAENLKVDAAVGDICRLPWSDNCFDAVIDCQCLCCNDFEATMQILAETHRVCKPGGKFLSVTFAPGMHGCDEVLEAPGHFVPGVSVGPLANTGGVRITTEDDIVALYGKFFKILSIDHVSRTSFNRTSTVNEWVIVCEKQ